MMVDRALAARFVIATAVLFAGTEARAAPMDTGNHFLPDCKAIQNVNEPATFGQGMCLGTISALRDVQRFIVYNNGALRFCIPVSVTDGQLVRVVIRYLEYNPAQLHHNFTDLAVSAISAAYPCDEGLTPKR